MVTRYYTRRHTRLPHSTLLLNDCQEPRNVRSVQALPVAASPNLYVKSGRRYLPVSADDILSHIRNWTTERFRPGAPVLDSPRLMEAFLLTKLGAREKEVFALILLDEARRLIEYVEISHGTRDSARVQLCDVVRIAVRHGAHSVALVHNHPSGRAEPSQADLITTHRIKTALDMVEIRVIDHLIVGATEVMSFVQRGLMR